ncbi:MAG: UDP-N-acetylmuramoyl-tripeptide--D-alanyl-D-alanine ligase, partial [Eubacterium sp.]
METVLFILLLASFAANFTMLILYYLHMFQLHSYKPKEQLRWLKTNFVSAVIGKNFGTLLTIPLLLFGGMIGQGISVPVLIFSSFFCRPKKAKKPLVYTNRIKRLLTTLFILLAVSISFTIFFRNAWTTGILLPLMQLLAALLVLLANIMNHPIEKSINRFYINDAKHLIEEMPCLKVIGITGSYGKTSVKFFLNKLLSAQYNVLMTPESFNTTLGVVRTIRSSLKATHDIFICEMGAKNIGDIKEICDIVHPSYGIITSIGPQHLESFLTIENVTRTKFELADALPENGIAFLNNDNEYIRKRPVQKSVIRYGIEQLDSDYLATKIEVSDKGSSFHIRVDDQDYRFETRLIGSHNVANIVGAIAAAHTLGVSMTDLIRQVKSLESVPHRLQLIRGNHALIIDDAYNSNPSGAKAALDTLATFDGVKILVTPGMVELGTKQDECNRIFGTQAAAVCNHVVLVGEKQTKSIYE